MNVSMPLYKPLVPDNKYDFVFEQTFADTQVTVALRPLSLPGDWPLIAKWVFRDIARSLSPATHLPEKHLRETFSIMLQCDFAQPFIGLVNGLPSFLVEICDGDKHCDGLDAGPHIYEKGDHAIRLFLSPAMINTQRVREQVMHTILPYFFSYRQVQRIVWSLHEKDRQYKQLAHQSGFTAITSPDWPGIHIYLYQREKYVLFSVNHTQPIQKLP
jgi:hypothetical protein